MKKFFIFLLLSLNIAYSYELPRDLKVNHEDYQYEENREKYGMGWIFFTKTNSKKILSYKEKSLSLRFKVRHPRTDFKDLTIRLSFKYNDKWFGFPIKSINPTSKPDDDFYTIDYSCSIPKEALVDSRIHFQLTKTFSHYEHLTLHFPPSLP